MVASRALAQPRLPPRRRSGVSRFTRQLYGWPRATLRGRLARAFFRGEIWGRARYRGGILRAV